MAVRDTDEGARFMRAVAAFSAAPEKITPLGRVLYQPEDEALSALLTEINETVLKRRLTFRRADDRSLTLDVCERRILLLRKGSSSVSDSDHLAERELVASDGLALLAVLQGFTEDQNKLFVSAQLADSGGSAMPGGVSANELFKLLEEAPCTLSLPAEVARRIEDTKPMALGLLCTSGSRTAMLLGNDEYSATIGRVMAAASEAADQSDEVLLVQGGLSAEISVVFVRYRAISLCVVVSQDHSAECFTLWHDLVSND